MKIPTLFMLVGLPGAGKSTYIVNLGSVRVHSSDALRQELYGDINDQSHNQELFTELHRRIKSDLMNGFDVVYDATNLNKKKRIAFLQELKNIACQKCCVLFLTQYKVCCERNAARSRVVPDHAMRKMYMNFQPPDYREGFNHIIQVYDDTPLDTYYDWYNFMHGTNDFVGANKFDQENHNHSLSLGGHMTKAKKFVQIYHPSNENLIMAAMLHDNGKVFTKTHLNSKGVDDGNCHYYQHHCVGAYDAFFFMDAMNYGSFDDRLYVSNLIYYHMHPMMAWKQSDKARARDRVQMGEEMYQDVMRLHNADVAAH